MLRSATLSRPAAAGAVLVRAGEFAEDGLIEGQSSCNERNALVGGVAAVLLFSILLTFGAAQILMADVKPAPVGRVSPMAGSDMPAQVIGASIVPHVDHTL
jgi:hypothetical protein